MLQTTEKTRNASLNWRYLPVWLASHPKPPSSLLSHVSTVERKDIPHFLNLHPARRAAEERGGHKMQGQGAPRGLNLGASVSGPSLITAVRVTPGHLTSHTFAGCRLFCIYYGNILQYFSNVLRRGRSSACFSIPGCLVKEILR